MLANSIRVLRKQARMSQETLAEKADSIRCISAKSNAERSGSASVRCCASPTRSRSRFPISLRSYEHRQIVEAHESIGESSTFTDSGPTLVQSLVVCDR